MAADKQESYLVSFHIISLIAKLLDPGRNPFSESFKRVFEGADSDTLEKVVIKMKHYAVMSKGINFEKGHLIKCLEWLQNSSAHSGMKILNKNSDSDLKSSEKGSKEEVEHVLKSGDDKKLYNEWKEFSANQSRNNDSKNSKSVLIQKHTEEPGYFEGSRYGLYKDSSNKVLKNRPSDNNSFLNATSSPSLIGETTSGLDEEMNMPDLSNLPTMQKTKSFTLNSVNDDLKGKNKRFSVMKVIPDDVKEQAGRLANSIAESILIDEDEKNGECTFNIPEGIHHFTQEVKVKPEVQSLKQYIFTIQMCRNSILDYDEKEQTMRIIEKHDNFEIVEIRKKFNNKPLTSSEQGEASQNQSSKEDVSITTSADSNSCGEIGGKNKPLRRVYYIARILNEDKISLVFLEFDCKTKKMIEQDYTIIAIADKVQPREANAEFTESFGSSEGHNDSTGAEQASIEINYMHTDGYEHHEGTNSDAICKILTEMVECASVD